MLVRSLGITGENLANYFSAAEFVPWYSDLPDYQNLEINLDGKVAIVIGAGNVAMDCARMLALEPTELDQTDTADRAMESFHKSSIRKVYITGRRGPEHAAFTAPELRELSHLKHTDVYFNLEELDEAIVRFATSGQVDKHITSNLEAMKHVAQSPKQGHERSMEFLFLHSPKVIVGQEKVEIGRAHV